MSLISKVDLSGERFTRLLVIEERVTSKGRRWYCRCDCGKHSYVETKNLKSGHTRSCGCFKDETMAAGNPKHGLSKHPQYKLWINIRYRARKTGMSTPPEWEDFSAFIADVGVRPSTRHYLTRKDLSLGYSKDNAVWAGPNVD